MSNFNGQLQQASFRGVPFAVEGAENLFGRRVALHQYPFRDLPWGEDIGRGARAFQITGFLISDSFVYGGGSAIAQRAALIRAVETKGSGVLIHPTLGVLNVMVPEKGLRVAESMDQLGRFPFTMECIESGDRSFPSALQQAIDLIRTVVGILNSAASGDYLGALTGAATFFNPSIANAIGQGAAVISTIQSTAQLFSSAVNVAASDATSLFNMLVELPPPNALSSWGRFAAGSTIGFTTTALPPATDATVDSLIADGVTERLAVSEACTALNTAAGGADPAATAAAAQAAVTALVSATADPGDAIRVLTALFDFYPAGTFPASVIGNAQAFAQTATASVIRRAVLGGIATCTANYQPSSADDAANIRDQVAALFDAELETAGSTGDDASYCALLNVRAAMVADLNNRGSGLPGLKTIKVNSSLPSLVLAQMLYQDPTRADELVQESNAAHPAFLPLSFKVLAD